MTLRIPLKTLSAAARREYNRLAQKAWRLRNAPKKGKRVGL